MVTYEKSSKTTTLRKTRKRKESKVVSCVVEIGFGNGTTIYVYEGTLSDNDLLIKFRDKRIAGTQERQPSHIHWAVDLLIKKDNQPELTNSFLKAMLERWYQIKSLDNRECQTVINNLIISKDKEFIDKYQELDKF